MTFPVEACVQLRLSSALAWLRRPTKQAMMRWRNDVIGLVCSSDNLVSIDDSHSGHKRFEKSELTLSVSFQRGRISTHHSSGLWWEETPILQLVTYLLKIRAPFP